MELYFLRHGLAGQHGDPKYKDDSLRPLTEQGKKKLSRSAGGMKALGLKFDVVLSSPYVRARQTAQVIVEAYGTEKKSIYLTDNLLPPAPAKALLQEIRKTFPQAQGVLLVGHEPHLTRMIAELLKSRPLAIDFKKGGLCCLTVDGESSGVLNWLLIPDQMAAIKRG